MYEYVSPPSPARSLAAPDRAATLRATFALPVALVLVSVAALLPRITLPTRVVAGSADDTVPDVADAIDAFLKEHVQ